MILFPVPVPPKWSLVYRFQKRRGFILVGLAAKNRLAVLTCFWDAPEMCSDTGQGVAVTCR